jgi:hypothetical protein
MWDEDPAGVWICQECGAECHSYIEVRACEDRDLSESD